jgi:two-component system phosphate regulon sensor histidine kinase PhoR
MRLAFSPKLRLAPLWPALVALATVTALGLAAMPGILTRAATDDLVSTVRLLAPGFRVPATPPYDELEREVRALAAGGDRRITVIALDGTVIADSDRTPGEVRQMENHRHRPEVEAALATGEGTATRHSDTLDREMVYAARRVVAPGGPPGGFVLRLAEPVRALAAVEAHATRTVLAAAAVALAVVALLSWWISRTVFRPLSRLIVAADRLRQGDYDVEIPVPDEGELATLGRALGRIAGQAKAQIAALGAERDHLRSTVGSMAEGVLVTDAKGRVEMVNPAFRRLFGLREEAQGPSLLELVRLPELADLAERTLAGGAGGTLQLVLHEPVERTLACTSTPLAGGLGAVVVARDVTESERLHQMRRDFVANVSHELKTPLAAIRGYAETLADGAADDPPTALRFSQRILEQCRRLGALLEDLLTLSRLEGTEPLASRESVDLRETAAEAIELLRPTAEQRGVELALEPGPSPRIAGDPEGLIRLAANLIDNAIKYNRPRGTVRVRLGEDPESASFAVEDTGIGIPPAALPRIFERFYRVDKGRSREEGGTGLGLAIVKHVAQAHGGRVEVESRLGEGSRFRVVLPRVSTVA